MGQPQALLHMSGIELLVTTPGVGLRGGFETASNKLFVALYAIAAF
jgi:hypothetical protein